MKLDVNWKLADILRSSINVLLGLVEILLGLRVVLKLFNAKVSNEFVSWVYDTSAPLIDPFEDIFTTVRLEDGLIVEPSTLFAMLVYGLVAFLFLALVDKFDKKRR